MSRSKYWLAVIWFSIVGSIVLVQSGQYKGTMYKPTSSKPDLVIELTGRYYVGVKHLLAGNPALKNILPQLEQAFRKIHRNGIQLSSIPVLAELPGRETALRELRRIAENQDKVTGAGDITIFQKLYTEGSDALDSEERLTLERYGWLGKLALSQDKPDTDPERRAVLKSASRTVLILGIYLISIIVFLLGGLVLLIVAIVRWIKGKLKSRLLIPDNPGSPLLESFAIFSVLSIVIPFLILKIAPGFSIAAFISYILFMLLSIPWLLIHGAGWKDCRTALGWNLGKGFFREIGSGILGVIAGLPLLFCALIAGAILSRLTGVVPHQHPGINALGRSPILLFIAVCVWAPFTEETLFRGALYGYLRRSLSWVVSGIISGLIFAMFHPQGWVAAPVLGTVGFILAAIREWRGSNIASMTAHAMINGMAALVVSFGLS